MGQDDQQQNGGAVTQDTTQQDASSLQGDGSEVGASAPASPPIPANPSLPEFTGAGTGNGMAGPALEPLPAAVVPPEEQLKQANLSGARPDNPLHDATNAAKDNLPPIPEDSVLEALPDSDVQDLAHLYGLPCESRADGIAGLKKRRDGVALTSMAHPNDAFTDFDPTNPREFDPTVVLLHLERDGVVAEGFIDPFTGAGTHDLLVALQDELSKARAKAEATGQPMAPVKVVVGETPDPNALKRQRAAALGHDLDPETGRCRKCRAAEWACLDGAPCEVRTDAASVVAAAEADGQTTAERVDDLKHEGITVEEPAEPIEEVDHGEAHVEEAERPAG
jgi:hypothetical protein